jgi:hypothetical protein
MQQQLEGAVAQAVAAAQERVGAFLEAANASRAAAEADVIELRQALAGRDETLAALQARLDEALQQQQQGLVQQGVGQEQEAGVTAAAAAAAGSSGLAALQQQVAALQEEVGGLRRELAAAHQRTHEVTQMYLSAAAAAAAAPPAAAAPAAGGSSSSSRFLPPLPGMGGRGRGLSGGAGGRVLQPKGLLGLYKRPQVRGLFVMYFVAVHAAVSAIVMRVS